MPKLKVALYEAVTIAGKGYKPAVLAPDGSIMADEEGERETIPAQTPVWLEEDLALRLLRQIGGWRLYD